MLTPGFTRTLHVGRLLRGFALCVGASALLLCGCTSNRVVEDARAAEERIERIVVPLPGPLDQTPFAMKRAWVMNDLLFDEGQTSLSPMAREILEQLADWRRAEAPRGRIRIYGHTDAVGSARENLRVARLRGESVRSYLIEKGVPPDSVDVVPVGESAPTEANDTVRGRSANRRVVILVVDDPAGP